MPTCTIQTKMEPLYLWQDPAKSGPIFGSVLVVLLAFQFFSVISVIAYSGLCALASVAGIKLYVFVMNTFLKKDIVSPLDQFADCDPTVSNEVAMKVATKMVGRINDASEALLRLVLIDNVIDSAKFAGLLYATTYIGCCFNATTLFILAWIALFSVPKLYMRHRTQIDPILGKVTAQLNDIRAKVSSATSRPSTKKAGAASTSSSAGSVDGNEISSSDNNDLLGELGSADDARKND